MRLLLTIAPLLFLIGCSASGPPQFTIEPGAYPAAFDAAREVLRDHAYKLERVDAQAGVITTIAKPTAGLATPWDGDQTSPGQEIGELFNQRARTVRITFEPQTPDAAKPGELLADTTAPLVGHVQVTIWQRQVTNLRLNPKGVGLTNESIDPSLIAQGVGSRFDVPLERDNPLAVRLAREIEKALSAKPTATAGIAPTATRSTNE